jgi:hypothetical protein
LLTLLVVPVVYSLVEGLKRRARRLVSREPSPQVAEAEAPGI